MIFKDINLEELFLLMKEHDIAETTLQNGKTTVTVKRDKEPIILKDGAIIDRSSENYSRREFPGTIGQMELSAKMGEARIGEAGGSPVVPPALPDEPPDENSHKVKAPLVGTFYRSPAPNQDPYVKEGDQVNIGDVLCIVEAMKSMNEIQSDVKGVVKEVCIENAQLVEFEQTMFKIDPN